MAQGQAVSFRGSKNAAAAEAAAKQALEAGRVCLETVHSALALTDVPLNKNRKNVIPHGLEAIRGAVCGLYVFAGRIGVSSFSQQHPWLTKLLVAFCQKKKPGLKFTSIQVNVNYASRPHVDRNNLGASAIIAFGSYRGGDLWVHDENGDVPHLLADNLRLERCKYKKGETYMGRKTNIKGRWLEFDGNRLHFTTPFHGTRYSLVYFTLDRYAEVSEPIRKELHGLGFTFQWGSRQLQKMLVTKQSERQRIHELFSKELNSMHVGIIPQLLDEDCIRYSPENPKLDGCQAHIRYEKYRHAKKIGEAVLLGALAIDLVYDFNREFLTVVDLHPKLNKWDFEVKDIRTRKVLPKATAVGKRSESSVKVRLGGMSSAHKGINVTRKVLSLLAARIKCLRLTPDYRWAEQDGPISSVPLGVFRVLLHWASSGRLRFQHAQKQKLSDVLLSWGEKSLAQQVANVDVQTEYDSAPALKSSRNILPMKARVCSAPKGIKRKRKREQEKVLQRPERHLIGCKRKGTGARLRHEARKRKSRSCPSDDLDKIRYDKQNPKRCDAWNRYEQYKKARTVREALDLGATRRDICYDFANGFLTKR